MQSKLNVLGGIYQSTNYTCRLKMIQNDISESGIYVFTFAGA